ncbi:MAG: methyltransferase [Dehalococcoidales bacterium]|nr:methyltransferase [Dehalococcoidales bacterium]
MDEDVYFHKNVTFHAWKHSLRFRVSQELFSSHDIDTGTRFLLRTIVEADYERMQRILDLGCGYGPLGLTLKSLHPDSLVHMVDRDALAVEYSRQNAELNGLDGVDIYGSLGYDDVKRNDFDLVIANIPGKAGESVIAYLLREAGCYLAPCGLAAIVVVAPLEETVLKILDDTPGVEVTLRQNRSGYAIFHYRFYGETTSPKPEQSAMERGVYHRKDVKMRPENLDYPMQTACGLPEFDSLSYGSEMLVKAIAYAKGLKIHRAVVFNPGQGHTAVALWKFIRPENIALVDRDLLALRYSQLNLILNECPAGQVSISHQVGITSQNKGKVDLFIGVLREEEGKNATFLILKQAAEQLSAKGMIVVSAGSTAITRLVTYVESQGLLRIRTRERWKGNSLLVLERA